MKSVKYEGANDLFVIEAIIPTAGYCSEDSTAIIYQQQPVKRLGWINSIRLDGHGYYLTGIAVGPDRSGSRVFATGWLMTNCSAWNGKAIRIDRLTGGSVFNILRRDLNAYTTDAEEVVSPSISGDVVTFLYEAGSFIFDVFITPGIARYRLTDGRAQREAPIALTVAGFIGEWLDLSGAELKRWSTSNALSMHGMVAAEAKGSAASLRMLDVVDRLSKPCTVLPEGPAEIRKELPR